MVQKRQTNVLKDIDIVQFRLRKNRGIFRDKDTANNLRALQEKDRIF